IEAAGPLWAATHGGVLTGRAGEPEARPHQAQTWGLGRVLALEHPRRWGGLVDLPEAADDASVDRLAAVLSGLPHEEGDGHEDQVAVRASGTYARRLIRVPLEAEPAVREWNPRGTVLITGGTGGIGAQVADWFARNGAGHLLLTSRRGPDAPGAAELRAKLEELGVAVTLTACDMADRDAVAALVAGVPEDRPLTAVVHTAGVPQTYVSVTDTTAEDVARITSGKVAGAVHLDEVLGDTPLDAFVVFSSNAAVWGSGGQGAYAAGNAFLDLFAEARRARGRTATSVAWGAWGGGGMMALDGATEYMERRGVLEMAPELAISAMVQAVEHDETFVAVADVEWERLVLGFTAARPSPLLAELPEVRRALREAEGGGAEDATTGAALTARLTGLSENDQLKELLELVRTEVAVVLGHSGTEGIEAGMAFKEIGFDSLTAVELRNRLAAATGLRLPASLVFDHTTPAALARHLRTQVVPESRGGAAESVLGGLEVLEAGVAGLVGDGESAVKVAERLEALVWKLRDSGVVPGEGTAATVGSGPEAAEDDLASASAEEMFDLLDKEWGDS
ncbi:beta-ketoacyl reductase, partial [Streptomyces sp. MK37H]|uniref:type I polyketide synthase n=1 Tax=Streptomyces sp. MK37H TaxID=2699117 RepID=UPI001B361B9C